jgi:hypothetical protein
MHPDMKQAVLEGLSWWFDHIYDGGSLPSWVDTMMIHYCVDDGVTEGQDMLRYIEQEIEAYKAQEVRS